MYICENVQSHESKCTIPKRISSCLVIFWSAMQFFLHYFFRMVFYSVATHNISLFLLLEKYLFLCKYPRGYFVSKCRDTVKKKLLMIFKDNNSNIHFIVNYFNDWYKDEYFIGLFFFCFKLMFFSGRAFLSIWAASVTSTISYRAKPTCSSLLRRTKKVRALREWDDGIVQPLSTITTKTAV